MAKKTILTAMKVTDPRLLALQSRYLDSDIVSYITEPTPKEAILNRKGRGGNYDYVPVYYFVSKANALFGFAWDVVVEREGIIEEDIEIEDLSKIPPPEPNQPRRLGPKAQVPTKTVKQPSQVWVEGYISVTIPGHSVYIDGKEIHYDPIVIKKHAYGGKDIAYYEEGGIIDIGDDFKGAQADMLKKAFSYMGFQVDVYGKREVDEALAGGLTGQQLRTLLTRGAYLGDTDEIRTEKLEKMADVNFHQGLQSLDTTKYLRLLKIVEQGKVKPA